MPRPAAGSRGEQEVTVEFLNGRRSSSVAFRRERAHLGRLHRHQCGRVISAPPRLGRSQEAVCSGQAAVSASLVAASIRSSKARPAPRASRTGQAVALEMCRPSAVDGVFCSVPTAGSVSCARSTGSAWASITVAAAVSSRRGMRPRAATGDLRRSADHVGKADRVQRLGSPAWGSPMWWLGSSAVPQDGATTSSPWCRAPAARRAS